MTRTPGNALPSVGGGAGLTRHDIGAAGTFPLELTGSTVTVVPVELQGFNLE